MTYASNDIGLPPAAKVVARHTDDPADFGRVGVLFGGTSAERAVSLTSGQAVLQGLLSAGVDAHPIDVGPNAIREIQGAEIDRVFNILHGRGGEDGVIQGALQLLKIPFTGSGVLASALAMDKQRTKMMWKACGLPVAPSRCVTTETELFEVAESLGFPLAVKPVHEGSSLGVSKVVDEEQLQVAWFDAGRFDAEVMVEYWINGDEYTIGIVGDEALPAVKLETTRAFYDYEAKYSNASKTKYMCPCDLTSSKEKELGNCALKAFNAVGATGWGRVDLMLKDNELYLLEVNTNPGMTSHSLVPMAAAAAGMNFERLVWRILETTL